MKIKLFVSHRIDTDSFVIKNDIITPVYCGAVYKKDKWNKDIIGDNTGDNISELRMNFNELTVQYWAWKNVEADYYGLCHYRRYFALQNENDGHINEQNQIHICNYNWHIIQHYKIASIYLINKYCKHSSGIIPAPADVRKIKAFGKIQNTVLELWEAHDGVFFEKIFLDELLNEILTIKPEFYDSACDYLNQNMHIGYNCFILNKKLFLGLCEFQFPILFKFIKDIKYKKTIKNYPRTLGYMGEILFGIYIYSLIVKGENLIPKHLVFFYLVTRVSSYVYYKNVCKLYLKNIIIKYFPSIIQKWVKILYHKLNK